MASHFKQPDSTEKTEAPVASRKTPLIAAAVVVALALCGAGLWWAFGQMGSAPQGQVDEPQQVTPPVSDDPAADDVDEEPVEEEPEDTGLPFSLEGVEVTGDVREVSAEGAAKATLEGEWTFGGDYVRIGSFPIDAQTVFGSTTSDANDLTAYVAALVSTSGDQALEGVQTEEPFFEPQDGTGTAERLVWRSSELSFVPTTGTDNWRLQTWDAATGQVLTLGSAESLNGTADTPMLDGEIVPTANSTHALFASYRSVDGSWVPTVLAYDLSVVGGEPVIIGEGGYPAAIEGGALWAGVRDGGDVANGLTTLWRWDGASSSEVFSVSCEEGTWGITGVWACGSTRAVALSSSDVSQGCYIGIWKDDFSSFAGWLHVASPRAVGSLNENWFVWGAGSEAENTDMFAYRIADGETLLLGNAPGYARPSIALESDVVLVPVSDGYNAASFRVGILGS